jgi:glycine betaine/choline ABC-type transport system substrate-binding protein
MEMINKITQYLLLLALAVVLSGCGDEQHTLRVGSKKFAESMIHAEMIAQLAENEGIKVERNIPFGDTMEVMEATKQNVLDIYPEYNGTGLIFLGQAPISDGTASTAKVQELFNPLGLEFKGRFGFSNDYAIVMTAERAQELGVSNIGDLVNSGAPINFAVDEDFSTRAADGLRPMTRRYGITTGEVSVFPGGSEGKDKIVLALLDGSADVAELFVTDGQIAEYNLVLLEDNQKFFPVYEPAPLVRSDALAKLPALSGVLDKLSGAISATDMQAMNKAVDLDAQTPASVATAFLVAKGLLPQGSAGSSVEKLLIAAAPDTRSGSESAKALRAIRAGFTGKDLEVLPVADPLQALVDGRARVAMIGAEAFYQQGNDGPVAKGNARAFAVLGYKSAHLIARKSDGVNSITDMKKIATGPAGSGSAVVLDMLLNSLGLAGSVVVAQLDGEFDGRVEGLSAGEYDGVFEMDAQGSRRIGTVLKDATLKLVGIDEWAQGGHTAKYSFIRPTTIAALSYPSQTGAISSMSTQFVLASPVRKQQEAGEVGPGTTGVASAVPVSDKAVKAIGAALGTDEAVDPAIPVHAALLPKIEVVDKTLPFRFDVSLINILMILFTIWVLYLCTLPSPREFTMPDEQ